MLNKMITNVVQLQRSEVYIANVVKCRPPNNRNPEPDEVEACKPFLERQIRAVKPRLLLVLGGTALHALFGVTGITRARGQWLSYLDIPALPTFHPAYLLRKPEDKRFVFDDLKALRARLSALPPRES
jgi:DNA polymerase